MTELALWIQPVESAPEKTSFDSRGVAGRCRLFVSRLGACDSLRSNTVWIQPVDGGVVGPSQVET